MSNHIKMYVRTLVNADPEASLYQVCGTCIMHLLFIIYHISIYFVKL